MPLIALAMSWSFLISWSMLSSAFAVWIYAVIVIVIEITMAITKITVIVTIENLTHSTI
jgi:hypothetical protein